MVYDISWAAKLLQGGHGTDHGNQRSDLASHFSASPLYRKKISSLMYLNEPEQLMFSP